MAKELVEHSMAICVFSDKKMDVYVVHDCWT